MCNYKQVLVFTTKPSQYAKIMATDALPTHLSQVDVSVPVPIGSSNLGPIEGFICLIPDPNHKNYMTGVTVGGRCVRIYEL